jgi:penicillin-binding protein 1A
VQRQSKRSQSKAKKRRPFLLRLIYWGVAAAGIAILAGAAGTAFEAMKLPSDGDLLIPKRPPNIAILDENGILVANRGDTGGAAVKIGSLPPYLPKAFVAIEDRRFYSHWGVDPMGVLRALTHNLSGGGAVQGGSTLTQQLAKNLFLTSERTLARKIEEAVLALWLEHKYSKTQILELYVNRVYFGSGAYGVEAAAQKYFGHSARDVTLPEAALLAGLVKAPARLAPNRNPQGAKERAGQVIAAMAEEGYITNQMAELALAHPGKAIRARAQNGANYAADYVMDMVDDSAGTFDEDITVVTTLNASLQRAAETALREELDRRGGAFGVEQGALVAMDPNGAVKALVGGRDYSESEFNRAVSARRQPGSAFKPFVYLAALESGLTPATVREDAPINVKGWQPENYSRAFWGPVTLTRALALSLNTVAVRLGVEVGPKAVANTAHRLGIHSDLALNPSLALGTSEVTPLELVTAYVPFANGGIGVQPHIISKVKTASGKLLYQHKGGSNGRVIDPTRLAMMNSMLAETLLTGTARKAELPGWQAAGKTGTSQEFRDAWFVGYTSHLIAGIWLGNDDNSPTKKASGGNLPVAIWSRFMQAAHQGVPPQPLPGSWRRDEQAPSPALPAAESSPALSPFGNWPQAARRSEQQLPPDFARSGPPVPPADIPNPGPTFRAHGNPPAQSGFFNSLFGG